MNSVAGIAASSALMRGVDRLVQTNARHRSGMRVRRIAGGDGERLHLGIEHAARLDLVPVVVLGVDPEHRDRRDPVLGSHLFREANRVSAFSSVKSGPPKSPACWPVMMATVCGSRSRAAAAIAASGAPRLRC